MGKVRTLLSVVLSTTILSVAGVATPLAQSDLPMGEMAPAHVAGGEAATFRFVAPSGGHLALMALAESIDISITVNDEFGQAVEEGHADRDLFGNPGTERLSILIRRAGEYTVEVASFGGDGGDFEIGAAWLPVPGIELPPDPDGSPNDAMTLTPGTPHEDSLDTATGDTADWYVLEATADIVVTVITEGEDDVYLEAYADSDFGDYVHRSDQDLQGNSGSESVTMHLKAGEKAFFKVGHWSGSASYRLRAGVM